MRQWKNQPAGMTVKVSVILPAATKEAIDREAIRQSVKAHTIFTSSDVVRQALDNFLAEPREVAAVE